MFSCSENTKHKVELCQSTHYVSHIALTTQRYKYLSLKPKKGLFDTKYFYILGASLSHSDTAEQTPLVHAAKNGHRDTVIYLLGCQTGKEDRSSLDIEEGNIEQLVPGSRHALIAAAQNGHLDIVEYLLDTAELIVSFINLLL